MRHKAEQMCSVFIAVQIYAAKPQTSLPSDALPCTQSYVCSENTTLSESNTTETPKCVHFGQCQRLNKKQTQH